MNHAEQNTKGIGSIMEYGKKVAGRKLLAMRCVIERNSILFYFVGNLKFLEKL